jgi:hypothetical protein
LTLKIENAKKKLTDVMETVADGKRALYELKVTT